MDEYDAQAQDDLNFPGASWESSPAASIYQALWGAIRGNSNVIKRIFITGITPIPLGDDLQEPEALHNITFTPRYAHLCGISTSEVDYILRLVSPGTLESHEEKLRNITDFSGGFQFAMGTGADETTCNTEATVEYLRVGLSSLMTAKTY